MQHRVTTYAALFKQSAPFKHFDCNLANKDIRPILLPISRMFDLPPNSNKVFYKLNPNENIDILNIYMQGFQLTVYGGIQGAGGDCRSQLGPLWSKVQLGHAPVLGSVVRSGWSYQENGGDLHRRGLCEFSEGTVIDLCLVPVPPQH